MARDDDDWTGTPPEGRHTRDRAQPGFWNQNFRAVVVSSTILGVLICIVLVLAVL